MNQLFKIFLVNEEEAGKISKSPDDPHSHDFEELIVAIEGTLEHFIDFKVTNIDAPLVSFVTKGKVHRLIPRLKDDICKMWVMRFKSEFIPETTFQLYSFYHDHANIKMQEGMCFNRMITLCEMMSNEMQQAVPDYSVIRHLLSALFAMIESERKKINPDETEMQKTQNVTFKNFLKILEENFRRPEGAEFYAEKLFMSARNLNLICQSILHQTVTETIESGKINRKDWGLNWNAALETGGVLVSDEIRIGAEVQFIKQPE